MKRVLVVAIAALFSASAGLAQNSGTGVPFYSSIDSDGFDAVNRQNLNVYFTIPIMTSLGRGLNLNMGVSYNSLIWTKVNGAWTPASGQSGAFTWGWNGFSPIGQIPYTQTTTLACQVCILPNNCRNYYKTTFSGYSYVEPNGTVHPFNVNWWTIPQPCSGAGTFGTKTGYATDGSGYYIDASSGTSAVVTSPSGIQIFVPNSTSANKLTDTNGNYIQSNYVSSTETDWIDSVGRTALKIQTNTLNSSFGYSYLDQNGSYSMVVNVSRSAVPIKTNFGCAGVVEYTGSATLITEIDLPNNQHFTFTYEATPGISGYYTGRLQRITLPTGGYYEFDYPGANDSINCSDGTTTRLNRVVNDGTTSNTWQFTRTQIDSTHWKTVVTAPKMPYDTAANDKVHTFTNGQETTEQIFQGSSSGGGTLLRTVNRTWSGVTPATRTTILEDGSTQSEVETSFDTNGNLLNMKEHDWGTGSPGFVLRTTTLTYGGPFLNRVTRKTVQDSTGTTKFRQDIAYDSTAITICPTGVPGHYDAYNCSYTTRGNPTSITTYANAAGASGAITKSFVYDAFGNLVSADVDCCQKKQWNFSASTQYTFPDSDVTGPSGNQLTTSYIYNQYKGWLTRATDPNGQQTSYGYDSFGRLTSTTRPDGVIVSGSYTDGSASSGSASIPIQGSDKKKISTTLDGLGRSIKTTTTDASGTSYSISETKYDPVGRPYVLFNPHNSTRQYNIERDFDALGRHVKTILQDGSTITKAYDRSTMTVSDPTGRQRKFQFDGVGHLTAIFEPDVNNGNALTQQTSLSYSVLDSLNTITQGVQTRTRQYDDIGRMLSMTSSESGTVGFQYNNFSQITQRTDALGVQTNYLYDARNRLLGINYTIPNGSGVASMPNVCTPQGGGQPAQHVCFYYDEGGAAANALGRLTHIQDPTGSETYTFDPKLSRTTQVQKVINGTTYVVTYAYNLVGELTSITYPSNRKVQQNFDGIGRLSTLADGTSGSHFADSFSYDPAYHITAFNYGNGAAAAFGYSVDRMQLQNITYAKSGVTLFGLTYAYGSVGSNNGEITGITDNVENGRSVAYTYDLLYRFVSAATTGSTAYPNWHLTWGYDRYGNRLNQTVAADTSPNLQPPPGSNSLSFANPGGAQTNHPDNTCFDLNGNLLTETPTNPCPPAAPTYSYDAENRLVSYMGSGATYVYDGNGLRVQKTSGGVNTVYLFSGTKVIAEYDNGAAPTAPSREYIYSSGTLLSKIESGATTYFHPDHLSNRLITDSGGNVVAQRGHYPFGDTWYETGTTTKLKFTTYERDSESTNDFAVARYYINRFGRFNSADALGGSLSDPQSLNRYGYALNKPANMIDPSGLSPLCFFGPCGGFGGGSDLGFGCSSDGIAEPCWMASAELSSGAAVACPNNVCFGINGNTGQPVEFRAFADGSAGYLTFDAPVGWSVQDFQNAQNSVKKAASGTPTDPSKLTGRALDTYKLLIGLGVSPSDITIYQTGTQSFSAVLTDAGFDALMQSPYVDQNAGDAMLHYPYTDGGRDSNQTNSLHFVWFDENLTDYVGGSGVYMEFHMDAFNPWAGGFWGHWGCDVFHLCPH